MIILTWQAVFSIDRSGEESRERQRKGEREIIVKRLLCSLGNGGE